MFTACNDLFLQGSKDKDDDNDDVLALRFVWTFLTKLIEGVYIASLLWWKQPLISILNMSISAGASSEQKNIFNMFCDHFEKRELRCKQCDIPQVLLLVPSTYRNSNYIHLYKRNRKTWDVWHIYDHILKSTLWVLITSANVIFCKNMLISKRCRENKRKEREMLLLFFSGTNFFAYCYWLEETTIINIINNATITLPHGALTVFISNERPYDIFFKEVEVGT